MRTPVLSHPDIPELDARGLRRFALTVGPVIAVLFGAALPWLFELDYPRWPWIVGGVLVAWGIVHPVSLRPVHLLWMRFGLLMHRITTPLVLGVVYFLIVSPMSIVMRLFGRDALRRKRDRAARSYRVPSDDAPPNNVEKPY